MKSNWRGRSQLSLSSFGQISVCVHAHSVQLCNFVVVDTVWVVRQCHANVSVMSRNRKNEGTQLDRNKEHDNRNMKRQKMDTD